MPSKNSISERAVSLFDSNFNCAEGVLTAASEFMGKACPFVPSIATPFGAGMGRRGSVCGALTGAIMAIGLACGRTKATDDREKSYALALEAYNRFQDKFGSTFCLELTDCDLTTAEGRKKFDGQGVKKDKCCGYVSACGEMLEEMLERPGILTRK
ncbi:MAG: C-GCAxxG-C-C family protein [Candidatus Eisenbacteria bacterium]